MFHVSNKYFTNETLNKGAIIMDATLNNMGTKLKLSRGNRGIREVAEEIGISAATLSRIENGNLPDLNTFPKICKWLNVDPGDVLGTKKTEIKEAPPSFHLKAEKNLSPEAAQSLSQMILAAQVLFNT